MAQIQTGLNRVPHPVAGAFVEWIIPEHHHKVVFDDLAQQQLSSLAFVTKGCIWLVHILANNVMPAFSLPMFCAQGAAFALSFAGAPFGQGLFIAIFAGLLGLVLCDAYIYPTRGNAFHHGFDTLVGLVFVLFVEVFEVAFVPAHALPVRIMPRGFALALLTVSMVRVILQRSRQSEPFRYISYWTARIVTSLWMVAALVVFGENTPLAPPLVPDQDMWLLLLSIASLTVAFRLQKDALDGSFTGGFMTIFQDPKRLLRVNRTSSLWTAPRMKPQEFPRHLLFEVLAFGFYGLPLAIALLSWGAGHTPSAAVNWLGCVVYAGAMLSLSVVWIGVRKLNQDAADKLHKDSDTAE